MSDAATAFDPRALRDAFGTFMTGVTVVTTHDEEGKPIGFTANSFSSVSLAPPLVSICIANTSRNFHSFKRSSGFAINVLAEGQKEISNTFARPVSDRFSTVDWRVGPFGNPVLDGVSAWFDCDMFNQVEAGDHLILLGKVMCFETSPAPGLGYARGAYVTASAEVEALSQGAKLMVSALIAYEGKILLVGNEQGKLTLPEALVGPKGASAALEQLLSESGVQAEPGFIYSVYEDAARDHQHIAFLCQAGEGTPVQGAFTELSASTLMDVADPAMCTMLERFATESRMGNFGVYYGNQTSGHVRPVKSGGKVEK